jgi:hypothetical protein
MKLKDYLNQNIDDIVEDYIEIDIPESEEYDGQEIINWVTEPIYEERINK